MITNIKHEIGTKEWAEEIFRRLQQPKGWRKPSKRETDYALDIMMREGMIIKEKPKPKGIIDRLFPKKLQDN